MSVTPTPYGANTQSSPPFVCLLSPPDTGTLGVLKTGRHVLRGNSLDLPTASATSTSRDNVKVTFLPANSLESQGVYYCELSKTDLTTRVPVTIQTYGKFDFECLPDLHFSSQMFLLLIVFIPHSTATKCYL